MKYEYKAVSHQFRDDRLLGAQLNSIYAFGWELINTTSVSGNFNTSNIIILIFRRQIGD